MSRSRALVLAATISILAVALARSEAQFKSKSLQDAGGIVATMCVSDEILREKIRQILLDGLDEALKNQVENVFEIWMRDAAGQPGRANVGLKKAVAAYLQARVGTLTWSPPICEPGQPGLPP